MAGAGGGPDAAVAGPDGLASTGIYTYIHICIFIYEYIYIYICICICICICIYEFETGADLEEIAVLAEVDEELTAQFAPNLHTRPFIFAPFPRFNSNIPTLKYP